jgi:hypothetical protein
LKQFANNQTSVSLCFSNQTDLEEEEEGLEMKGLERDGEIGEGEAREGGCE